MRSVISVLAVTLAASSASIQAQPAWKPEVRPFVGTSIPTGGLRNVIGSEALFGVQVAAEVRPSLHLLGTLGWAPAQTRYVASDRGLDVLQYDVGVEVGSNQPFTNKVEFHPFWGLGAGARTYLYESDALTDRSCLSGYLSTGFEVQSGRTALRAEGRDNVLCYRSPMAGQKSGTRNDLNFSVGLAYHFR